MTKDIRSQMNQEDHFTKLVCTYVVDNHDAILQDYVREKSQSSLTPTPFPEPMPEWDTPRLRLTDADGHFPMELINAAKNDPDLTKLFVEELQTRDRIYDLEGHWFLQTGGGTGGGGSIYLSFFLSKLMTASVIIAHYNNDSSNVGLIKSTTEHLRQLRSLISGETEEILHISYVYGTSVDANTSVKTKAGTVRGITEGVWLTVWDNRIASEHTAASESGFVLEEYVLVKATIGKKEAMKMAFKEDNTPDGLQRSKIADIQLAIAAALEPNGRELTTQLYSTLLFDPFGGDSRSGTTRDFPTPPSSITNEELSLVVKFIENRASVEKTSIGIAESRLINALNERESLQDKILDAAIGLENVYGVSSYATKAIAIGLAKLLENNPDNTIRDKNREDIHREAKKLYDVRSKIIHGAKRHNYAELQKQTDIALGYLRKSIRALYEEENRSLLPLGSDDRFKKIALR